jgi:hypothetical protein
VVLQQISQIEKGFIKMRVILKHQEVIIIMFIRQIFQCEGSFIVAL